MNAITVSASKEYRVLIGSNLIPTLGTEVSAVINGRKVMIVSDSNVWPLYGATVANYLTEAGFQVSNFVFVAGEASKTPETYFMLLQALSENHLSRQDCVIALGGGVVGDLAGFAASTYQRGTGYVQVPTTVLAMVDSSVGGKTGIDLPAGKNLVGTFYQPNLVLCDTDILSTLPEQEFRSGCAEVIKYAILFDEALFQRLEEKGEHFDREVVISRCINWKKKTVEEDEYDTGCRQMLNLGHSIGHSIEKASHFSISHGFAVAAGIGIISRSATALGLCSKEDSNRIIDLLKQFSLPVTTIFTASELANIACGDKKRVANSINLIIPATIGCCKQHLLPLEMLESFIKEGL